MIQKPKGTYDVIGDKRIIYIQDLLKNLMEVYNYEYFRTPIFEASELFHRTVGQTSDIVTKETYDFKDRSDRAMTLRPEGTAGIVRSFIENKLYATHSVPLKAWYFGPMFRYERPQTGRFREFYQFGVEVIGANEAIIDAEVISIPVNFYKILGLKNVRVNINTLGDLESRDNYRQALINYFKPHINDLCEDCQDRFLKNPLRILDCKVDMESEILKGAPKITDYLNDYSKTYFENVLKCLDELDISYTVNPNIVRGLDYYTHTVFEVIADIPSMGAGNVICAGGRYDNLVSNLNGPDTPGVGFALGLERLLNILESENINLNIDEGIDLYVMYTDSVYKNKALKLCTDLRMLGFKTDMDYLKRSIKSNFKQADKLNAKYIIIIGEDEAQNNYVTINDNKTKESEKVDLDSLYEYLDNKLYEPCSCHKEDL